ncbi:MAG: hypothetical protein WDN24_19205 [Sphingomonas sp.]
MAGVTLALAASLQLGAIDWAALPSLPYRAPPLLTQSMSDFVAREARARRCPLPAAAARRRDLPAAPRQNLTVELAVLVDGEGEIRTVVPRAIRCPTVEQYAAGLAASFARGNLLPRAGDAEQWYRTSLTFSWQR